MILTSIPSRRRQAFRVPLKTSPTAVDNASDRIMPDRVRWLSALADHFGVHKLATMREPRGVWGVEAWVRANPGLEMRTAKPCAKGAHAGSRTRFSSTCAECHGAFTSVRKHTLRCAACALDRVRRRQRKPRPPPCVECGDKFARRGGRQTGRCTACQAEVSTDRDRAHKREWAQRQRDGEA